MRHLTAVTILLALAGASAQAQVLTTADTLGKGVQGVLASDSHIFVDDARLHIIAGQYVRGLTSRFDLYVIASDTRTDDETGTTVLDQFSLGAGGNWFSYTAQLRSDDCATRS